MSVLQAINLSKIYGNQKSTVAHKALDALNLTVEQGEFVGIMGPSGSGKTTLLQLLGSIDTPTSGDVLINGRNVSKMNPDELAMFRRRHLGFVFQEFNLLDAVTLKENIMIPLILEKRSVREIEQRITYLAERLGIAQVLGQHPYEVSGGQKQRAAAARALVHEPDLILADEPTGNLDSKSAKALMQSLASLNEQERSTILMVTHDPMTASYCKRILFIKDGKIFTEIRRGLDREQFYQKILAVLAGLGG